MLFGLMLAESCPRDSIALVYLGCGEPSLILRRIVGSSAVVTSVFPCAARLKSSQPHSCSHASIAERSTWIGDTTKPIAMLDNLRRIVLGNVLSDSSRERLTAWLVANKTGDPRLRASFPKTWRVGDKTGTGNHGVTNDIAIAWPPGRAPLIVSAYYAGSSASMDDRNAVLAEVAQIATART
jgi:Beta-lactamase enzyme family